MADYNAADAGNAENPRKPDTTDKEILAHARTRLKSCIDREVELRKRQKDDLLFSTLDQWPGDIRAQREGDVNGPRPCLTIDQINQYIVQVVNDMRQNKPAIKVRPVDSGGDIETAEVFMGLARQVEDQSSAQVAYMTAGDSAVRVGEGYFRFVTEYENERSFNQVIRIRRIPDMFACYLGPHIMPDGSDCDHAFVFEDLPVETFRRLYPKAKYQSTDFNELNDFRDQWTDTDKKIRVAEYFYFDYKPTKLYFVDGAAVTEKPEGFVENDENTREAMFHTVKWCKLTGIEVLQKREWAGKYIPIVKVTGKESWVDGQRITWGLVRPAKDSLRMYNYWASTITEKLALSPKSPFIGAKGQFEGFEDRWGNANKVNYAYLEYNPTSVDGLSVPPPQRQAPAPIEAAMIQQLAVIREDVQASLGMFRASLGKEQANQSGKAILALTRESDTGTFHFSDNLALSITHGGRIFVDLAPKIYDTKRVLKIVGEDGKIAEASIDPDQQEAMREIQLEAGKIQKIYNLNVGNYDVTVTTGPSFNTKRMEAATLFTDLAGSANDPVTGTVMKYLAIKNSDFNGAEQAAGMMEKLLPPGLIKKEGEPEIPPEVMQKMQMMEQAGNDLMAENQELKSGQQEAQAKVLSAHDAKMKELELQGVSDAKEARLAKERVDRELALKEYVAKEELRIKEETAHREMEIAAGVKSREIDVQADCDIDGAIAKVKNLAMLHEGKMKSHIDMASAGEEGETAGKANAEGKMVEMQKGFMDGINQIVEQLSAKKKISIIQKDGKAVGAEVTSG